MLERDVEEVQEPLRHGLVEAHLVSGPKILKAHNYGTLSHDDGIVYCGSLPSSGTPQSSRPSSTNTSRDGSGVDEPGSKPRRSPVGRRLVFIELLRTPRMLAAILGAFMQSFILTELESTMPLYIKRLFKYNSKDVALVFLVLSVPSFAAPGVGAMSDRYGPKTVVSAGFLCCAPLFILLRLINHDSQAQVILLCVLLLAIGAALNLILTPVFSEAMYTVDEKEAAQPGIFGPKGAYAQAFAQMNVAYASGSLLGPLVGGMFAERIGWNNLTLLTGISCAFCVPLSLYATGGTTARIRIWKLDCERTGTED